MVTLAGTQNLNEFELHLRAVLGLPIPGIKQERIGASAVILSPIASQERPQYRGMEEVTKEEDTYLRIFGKPFTRVNRRMGVVLCYAPLDSDLDALRDKAKRIAEKGGSILNIRSIFKIKTNSPEFINSGELSFYFKIGRYLRMCPNTKLVAGATIFFFFC